MTLSCGVFYFWGGWVCIQTMTNDNESSRTQHWSDRVNYFLDLLVVNGWPHPVIASVAFIASGSVCFSVPIRISVPLFGSAFLTHIPNRSGHRTPTTTGAAAGDPGASIAFHNKGTVTAPAAARRGSCSPWTGRLRISCEPVAFAARDAGRGGGPAGDARHRRR